MNEVWVRTNPRIYYAAAATVAIVGMVPGLMVHFFFATKAQTWWFFVAVAGFLAAAILVVLSRRPRVAYDGTNVRFYVRAGARVDVPVELVEAFLLGRGPTYLPGHGNDTTETTTLVVRISERAEEFNHVETTPTLAAWCGHYCTLRGTWTEPLGIELVNRLNQRLYDVQQAHKKRGAAPRAAAGASTVGAPVASSPVVNGSAVDPQVRS